MQTPDLAATARALVSPGKGILAADESTGTITKRFRKVGQPSNENTRRDYRETLLTTAGLEEFIAGVILYDETLRQSTREGVRFPDLLLRRGILPGIKVDVGTQPLPFFPGEKVTSGLDGLGERLAEYRDLGARFTKWRAVFTIGDGIPTRAGVEANAHALARFAALSQEAGLVPIVEPEVLMDGSHSIERCEAVTEGVLALVFAQLREYRVLLEGMLLKPSMVIEGESAQERAGSLGVVESTLRCLRRTVPAAVPGIVFLSGGQTELAATQHLNAMNRVGDTPWQLSFSYGRALQAPALEAWARGNPLQAQAALLHRARCNGAAANGQYSDELETQALAA